MGPDSGHFSWQKAGIHRLRIAQAPKAYDQYLLMDQSIGGTKLAEGDPSATYPVSQDDLAKYSEGWERIRAVAYDSFRHGNTFRERLMYQAALLGEIVIAVVFS